MGVMWREGGVRRCALVNAAIVKAKATEKKAFSAMFKAVRGRARARSEGRG